MNDDTTVVNFSELKEKLKNKKLGLPSSEVPMETKLNLEQLIHDGLDTFFTHLENGVTGFITFTFNENDGSVMPEVVIAGEIDPLRSMGSLQHIANGLSQSIYINETIGAINGLVLEQTVQGEDSSDDE